MKDRFSHSLITPSSSICTMPFRIEKTSIWSWIISQAVISVTTSARIAGFQRSKPVSTDTYFIFVEFFIACLMAGLEYIHNKSIIHRDIKPENLVFDEDGYLRITDFGIARQWRPENSQDTSGTPGYMGKCNRVNLSYST